MENLSAKISELELSLKDLKGLIDKQNEVFSASNLIMGCGATFTAVSVLTLPKWVPIASTVLMFGYFLFDKKKLSTQIGQKINGIQTLFESINSTLSQINLEALASQEEECRKKDETISFLKSNVERLKSLLKRNDTPPINTKSDDNEKSEAELNMLDLLRKFQKLDIVVDDFGTECASYMRKEFNKALRICGLEFADYSPENQVLFATEKAAIDSIDCTARAIVTNSTPRKIILKGHAFIPETN